MFHLHGHGIGHEHGEMGGHHFFHRFPLGGLLPLAVLSLIKDKPTHGGEIYQGLEEKFELKVPRPVIYILLRKLEKAGLMVSKWDIPESGPAKRTYTISEDGIEAIKFGLEKLKKVSKIINSLTGENPDLKVS